MKVFLINLLRVVLGEVLGEFFKKLFKGGKYKEVEFLLDKVIGVVRMVEDISVTVLMLRGQGVGLAEIREKVLENYGVPLSNVDIYNLEENKSEGKLALTKFLARQRLIDEGVKFTSNLLNLAIEMAVEKIK